MSRVKADLKKSHAPPASEWKFKRERHGTDHVKNCDTGYRKVCDAPPEKPQSAEPEKKRKASTHVFEIHHLLCVHACSDATLPPDIPDDEKEFIHLCLASTAWEINDGKNNIGLPTKWAYLKDPENGTGWDMIPCHQVDHGLYLKCVRAWMTKNVWLKMLDAEEAKQCEYLKGSNVAELFDRGSHEWRQFLDERGIECGGTKACLNYCLKGPEPGNKEHGDQMDDTCWFVPFSMSPYEPIERREKPPMGEPLLWDGLLGKIK